MRKEDIETILFWPIIIFFLVLSSLIGSIIGNYIWMIFIDYYFNNS